MIQLQMCFITSFECRHCSFSRIQLSITKKEKKNGTKEEKRTTVFVHALKNTRTNIIDSLRFILSAQPFIYFLLSIILHLQASNGTQGARRWTRRKRKERKRDVCTILRSRKRLGYLLARGRSNSHDGHLKRQEESVEC